MSRISDLSDELLIKILSYLPTKVAVSTSVLSKQWQFLWMWSPNLEFPNTVESELETLQLQCFLLRILPLYRAPVIERFILHRSGAFMNPEDVRVWVQFAISRDVHELDISYFSDYGNHDIFLSSLYTCKSLVTLKLDEVTLLEIHRMVCLPSLKTLLLQNVVFGNEDSLPWLLSNCPVLEDLSVYGFVDVGRLIVRVSSLQRLVLHVIDDLDEFVIDTSSLEYLKLYCDQTHEYTSIKNMPKLKEAFLDVSFTLFAELIGSIPSVKHLTLCLSLDNISEVVFDDGFVFNKLKHLKLCTCQANLILVQMLKVSPNLRILELFTMGCHGGCMEYLNQPSTVPECMLSSLETFKWSRYRGNKKERELVIYILQNAYRLKTATILLYEDLDKALDMKKELELSSRASTTCRLLFH